MDRLNWTAQAVKDVESICEFIAKDSPIYARLFAKDILQAVQRLGNFPKSGRIVPEFSNKNIREIILGNYRIIYRIKPAVTEILTVYHSARLLKSNIDKNT
ncbi:MAG: type II toxin-antitoxin system RelE/ParE family toxin [bacterium]